MSPFVLSVVFCAFSIDSLSSLLFPFLLNLWMFFSHSLCAKQMNFCLFKFSGNLRLGTENLRSEVSNILND